MNSEDPPFLISSVDLTSARAKIFWGSFPAWANAYASMLLLHKVKAVSRGESFDPVITTFCAWRMILWNWRAQRWRSDSVVLLSYVTETSRNLSTSNGKKTTKGIFKPKASPAKSRSPPAARLDIAICGVWVCNTLSISDLKSARALSINELGNRISWRSAWSIRCPVKSIMFKLLARQRGLV